MKQNGYGKIIRKTATDDIQALKDNGFAIYVDDSDVTNHYYYDGRPFQTVELKLLLDAVDAAVFISPSNSSDLYEKILSLASVYDREKLQLEHAADLKRMTSPKVLKVTDIMQQAIREKRRSSSKRRHRRKQEAFPAS